MGMLHLSSDRALVERRKNGEKIDETSSHGHIIPPLSFDAEHLRRLESSRLLSQGAHCPGTYLDSASHTSVGTGAIAQIPWTPFRGKSVSYIRFIYPKRNAYCDPQDTENE